MASWFRSSGKRAAHCPIPVLCVPVPLCQRDPKEKKNNEVSNRSRHAGWRAPGLDVGDSTWVPCDSVGVARLSRGSILGCKSIGRAKRPEGLAAGLLRAPSPGSEGPGRSPGRRRS